MPTKHPRIAVVADPELQAALADAAELLGEPELKPARLVRELALRGARALVEERDRREAALEWLADWSTSPDSTMNRELLLSREAWR